MRKIKILIVEDEVIIAKDIAYYLTELGCDIIGILVEGELVMPFLNKEQPDIILMDISLKGTLDGVQTVKLVQDVYNIPFMYLTANTDDRSFELAKATKPFAFIEKPFKPKRLVRTVELLIEQLVENKPEETEKEPVQFIMNDRIFVRDKGKMIKIVLTDILYIEADGAYSTIVSKSKSFVLAINLRNLENKISNSILMRVHRSYIINLQEIDSIADNYVHIHQKNIPVSRTHWQDFLNRVNLI